jgi:hypothetical protein
MRRWPNAASKILRRDSGGSRLKKGPRDEDGLGPDYALGVRGR